MSICPGARGEGGLFMAKILIVDDEKNVVELLSFIFQKDGHKTYIAMNGNEALQTVGLAETALTPIYPDLIILDIMMPDIDGYTVQTKLLENEKTKRIPIIILTAKGQMRDLFGMAANVAAYIEKPFDPQLLRTRVTEILEKK